MAVHYTILKRAMQIGCHLSELGPHRYRIFWPQYEIELFAPSADEALNEMEAVQTIQNEYPALKIVPVENDYQINVFNGNKRLASTPTFPTDVQSIFEAGEARWLHANGGQIGMQEVRHEEEDKIHGIPKDGGVAFRAGVPASDCPYLEESDDFSRWNDEWDKAADDATEKPKAAPLVGSIITNRYRALYSEHGHPTHCGDSLATLLNNLCSNKAGTNLELFEAICKANGVVLAKYNRTSKGWQGRLRMTGRNLLARKVRDNGGKLMMPPGLGQEFYTLDESWVAEAATKYKPKLRA